MVTTKKIRQCFYFGDLCYNLRQQNKPAKPAKPTCEDLKIGLATRKEEKIRDCVYTLGDCAVI